MGDSLKYQNGKKVRCCFFVYNVVVLKFLNLGMTMVLIMVICLLAGKYTGHLVFGIVAGVIMSVSYLFRLALKE